MPERRFYDYLIIGQGLAGSLLAWRLIEHGKRVLVLDDAHASSSSMVAAGVINPLAGKRFNHAPQVHAWLDAVESTYGELGQLAGKSFLHWKDMLRLFREPDQQRYHERLTGQTRILDLFGATFPASHPPQPVKAPWGGFIQKRTGYVRIPALLDFFSHWLRQHQALQITSVNHQDIEISAGRTSYGNLQAKGIIFCDGYRSMHNPWFSYLPFAPDKGEILTLEKKPGKGKGKLPDMIINAATWLLPMDDGHYRLGSTHNHDTQDNRPAQANVRKLLKGLEGILDNPQYLDLKKSEAGVRPATSDRQPFLGTHPLYPELHIFNGFGAHGSLSIPWYSEQMLRWLLHQQPLPGNADVGRFRV